MINKLHLLIFILLSNLYVHSQQTVGLFNYTSDANEGYTLFAPNKNNETFLIDNCGEKVHSWTSNHNPGVAVYLLNNGVLLRTGNISNNIFNGGGSGGIIEMIDWNGNVIWDYTLSSGTQTLHHDIEYLPNGNILAIVWDLHTSQQALAQGRTIVGNSVWSEKIIEIRPDLVNGGGTVVWEWSVWDHLIQEDDPAKPNYGSVGLAPRRIHLNYPQGSADEDWLHFNGIDYNEQLDQIMISVRTFNELWVIDHSTSTTQAASATGGNSGLGGRLLYRWGNPEAYNQGTVSDKLLFGQHHPHWIKDGLTDEGKILVFNNSNEVGSTPNQFYSTVNIINPVFDGNGGYEIQNSVFSPSGFYWTYTAQNPTDFFSRTLSGAQRLENGNTLICEGASGRFFEIDSNQNTVWEYINPVGNTVTAQGNSPRQNSVFRTLRYPSSYAGLTGKTLNPQGYLETGSSYSCTILNSSKKDMVNHDLFLFPNPAISHFIIKSPDTVEKIAFYDLSGKLLKELKMDNTHNTIDSSFLNKGLYILKIQMITGVVKNTKLVIN